MEMQIARAADGDIVSNADFPHRRQLQHWGDQPGFAGVVLGRARGKSPRVRIQVLDPGGAPMVEPKRGLPITLLIPSNVTVAVHG